MNIAICDDDRLFCQELEKYVEQSSIGSSGVFDCDVFYSGEELLQYLEENERTFHIYLLDIEMDGIDGIRLASIFRRRDIEALIIFVTCHESMMVKAFDVRAFHYLVKPLQKEKVLEVLDSAYDYLLKRKKCFQFTVRKKIHTVLFSEIEYFESIGRKINIHKANGEIFSFYSSLNEVMKQVDETQFIRIHQSYLVNLDYLQHVTSKEIVMRCGVALSISKRYQTSFHHAFRSYLFYRPGG
ncbi:DNA-binding response regulator [Enterococcus florum]|uniref:DNA-binding response regulator n=1 Tax=Enterococcus florum TaxID=2480627 RepID=A0A4P5PAS7_9ENTE|nr:LytTR family DNA-binding domain-containing protein [Enterococcus florum]GCF94766.1 DNA-binding response regulator [Enterococcus florum]